MTTIVCPNRTAELAREGRLSRATALSVYSNLKGDELLRVVNQLRREWHDNRHAYPIQRRGNKFYSGMHGAISMSKVQVIDQCVDLACNMQAKHDEDAALTIDRMTPHTVQMMSLADRKAYAILLEGIARLPKRVRMQALAFNGLTDEEIASC